MSEDRLKHQHFGKYLISWDEFYHRAQKMVLEITKIYQPEIVIGIAKGGLPLATVIASMLRLDLYPIRLSYREKDLVVREEPLWMVPVTEAVKGKKVLITDDTLHQTE